jgi:hypothetical protein
MIYIPAINGSNQFLQVTDNAFSDCLSSSIQNFVKKLPEKVQGIPSLRFLPLVEYQVPQQLVSLPLHTLLPI